MRTKNFRHHHKRRMFRRAYQLQIRRERNRLSSWLGSYLGSTSPKELHLRAQKERDNLAICSCPECGNKRRNEWDSPRYRLTLQELRNLDRWNEWMKDVDNQP